MAAALEHPAAFDSFENAPAPMTSLASSPPNTPPNTPPSAFLYSTGDHEQGSVSFQEALKRIVDMRGDPTAPRVTRDVADSCAKGLDDAARAFEAFKASTQLATSFRTAKAQLDLVDAERKTLQARLEAIDGVHAALEAAFKRANEIYKVVAHKPDDDTSTKLMHELAQVRGKVGSDLQDADARGNILRDRLTPAREIIAAAAMNFTGGAGAVTTMHCALCYEVLVGVAWSCGHTACQKCAERIKDPKCPVCRAPGAAFKLYFLADAGEDNVPVPA